MGYLICNRCGGYYKLHEGEVPDDFDRKCQCGGRLEYFDSLSRKLDKIYENRGKSTKPHTEHYFIPVLLIMVSIECIFSIFHSLSFIIILGVIGLIFGLIFLSIRLKSFDKKLYPPTRKIIYLFSSLLFFIEGISLVILWLQIDYSSTAKIGIPILIFLAVLCGISMFWKAVDPDNPRNLFDPP